MKKAKLKTDKSNKIIHQGGDEDGSNSKGVEVPTVRKRACIPCESSADYGGSGLSLLNNGNTKRRYGQSNWPVVNRVVPDNDCALDMGFVVMVDGIYRS